MLREILYDREISVSLYKPVQVTPVAYSSVLSNGYGNHPIPIAVNFYEGDERIIFVGYTNEEDEGGTTQYALYKRIIATGAVYKFRTLEEMQRGLRPDGSVMQTGDKVYVIDEKRSFNVYSTVGGQTVNTQEADIRTPVTVLHLKCTPGGLKPDMSFKISLLPNQNCYAATLRIKNFNIDMVNIRNWTKMVIKAGYRTGRTVQYTCPIFSSYVESPNPDGIVVFEGLTVGVAEDILENKTYEIHFNKDEIALTELVENIAKGIHPSCQADIAIDEDYVDLPISIPSKVVYAQNGLAIINWLQSTLSSAVETASGGNVSVFIQFIDGRLEVLTISGKQPKLQSFEGIINLDMVTSVVFNGTALTVIAPWNPTLRPGDLFFMPPEFINGAKLPNIIPTTAYRNEHNLYRAITIDVEFASVEQTNKMTILAVPAQYADKIPSTSTTSMTADTYARMLTEEQTTAKRSINVGDVKTEDIKASSKVEEKPKTGMELLDEHDDIITQWGGEGSWTSITVDTTTMGTCISSIAFYYTYIYENGPKLGPAGSKGIDKERSYYETKEWLEKNVSKKAGDKVQNTGIGAATLWWPMIAVGTYWRRYKDNEAGIQNNWTKIKLSNLNFLEANKAVYVPVFPSGTWRQNRSRFSAIKDIWKDAYKNYAADYPDIAPAWRAMYYYLGGTDDIG